MGQPDSFLTATRLSLYATKRNGAPAIPQVGQEETARPDMAAVAALGQGLASSARTAHAAMALGGMGRPAHALARQLVLQRTDPLSPDCQCCCSGPPAGGVALLTVLWSSAGALQSVSVASPWPAGPSAGGAGGRRAPQQVSRERGRLSGRELVSPVCCHVLLSVWWYLCGPCWVAVQCCAARGVVRDACGHAASLRPRCHPEAE